MIESALQWLGKYLTPMESPASQRHYADAKASNARHEELLRSQLAEVKVRNFIDDEDADRKYQLWRHKDPFPDIAPSLLNCEDFCNYIVTTGMISPFNPEPKDVKMASLAFRLKGKCVYWDSKGVERTCHIENGQVFRLRQNSIAFVTLEPYLRIPDYIALRFNLKIVNVYKGLLLGTGPLIDPGYRGELSIPLHNLTTNDYDLHGGDPLIWVEFTKITDHPQWSEAKSRMTRAEVYAPFPDPEGPKRDVSFQLLQAAPETGVQSSITKALADADKAVKSSGRIVAFNNVTNVIAILGVAAALVAIIWTAFTFYQYIGDNRKEIKQQENQINADAIQIQSDKETIRKLEKR